MFSQYKSQLQKMKTLFLCLLVSIMLSACGGGEGTTQTGVGGSNDDRSLAGCAGFDNMNADTSNFCVEFWNQSSLQNTCATCHKSDRAPYFMSSDINQAYQSINPYIDINNPANSPIVTKVLGTAAEGDGHNCWATDQVCADLVTTYIQNWVGQSANSARAIPLTSPTPVVPGSGKQFPATATTSTGGAGDTFEQLLYNPILIPYCATCHNTGNGDPLFAQPADLASSYQAAQSKINLDDPDTSRMVVKLPSETHNCWTVDVPNLATDFPMFNPGDYPGFGMGDDCIDNAAIIEDAITRFAAGITTNAIDPTVNVISNAMRIADGIVASGGSRFEANQIALYEFKSGQGTRAFDTSASGQPLDLTINDNDTGNITWAGGYGIKISGNGYLQGSTNLSDKLYNEIQSTGEYSLEAWVAPDNVTQMGSRIINYGNSDTNRNFSLSQTQYNYDFLGRNSLTTLNGDPAVSTPDADESLQATLQHVVATYDAVNGRQIYVNGILKTAADPQAGGSLINWETGHALVLGNEPAGAGNNAGLWKGTIKMVSIHNRALSQAAINQNLAAGVGEKFFLLFGIGQNPGVPANSYIMFEVSQFDDHSYLFIDPTFVSLDPGITNVSIPIRGMRIGINSKESPVGQAYMNIDTTITANNQSLSDIGTTIPLESGPDIDEFFLTFELLGTASYTPPVTNYTVPVPVNDPATSDIGLKTFDEINASMSAMTGVSPQTVASGYNNIKQQLPVAETINGFLPSHQIGITQLAMEYCDALVNNVAARDAYFPAFSDVGGGVNNFNVGAATAFDTDIEKDAIINPLLLAVNGTGMDLQADTGTFARGGTAHDASDPDVYTSKSELDALIDNLTACAGACDNTTQTAKVVKATCTAALASAITLIQ